MTRRVFTLNKNDLTKEEQAQVSTFYKGLTALRDTLTEATYDENGKLTYSCTYYIFKGRWTPYSACVLHNNRYVFARYSRYDSVDTDFTDFAIDCDEHGKDHDVFITKHFAVENNEVTY